MSLFSHLCCCLCVTDVWSDKNKIPAAKKSLSLNSTAVCVRFTENAPEFVKDALESSLTKIISCKILPDGVS